MNGVSWPKLALGTIVLALSIPVNGSDALRVSGYGLLRAATPADEAPFYDAAFTPKLQLGIDWQPSLYFAARAHLVARRDAAGSHRDAAGVTQAYLEANVPIAGERLRVLAGAFFLPGSKENVDALWESPYAISSSALNSWMGEEFRPIGIDVSYTFPHAVTAGATVYRGNETFGALPADRGWSLRDHWTLLGEHFRVDDEYFTSISAENDGRLGWSGRAAWKNEFVSAQLTHIDNRADGRLYGDLLNWDTQFTIAGADLTLRGWTVAAEAGRGETAIVLDDGRYVDDIDAAYVLVSRRFPRGRATLRQDWFGVDDDCGVATTAALLFELENGLRPGIEVSVADDTTRVLVELRYHFTAR